MEFHLKKVTCAFCKCEMVYKDGHIKRLIRHVKFEHGIIFNVKYIMASCFLAESEMDAVTDIVFKKNSLEVSDDEVTDVTLHKNVVRKKAIDININTGATYTRVLDKTSISKSSTVSNTSADHTDSSDSRGSRTRNKVEENSGNRVKRTLVSDRKDGSITKIPKRNEGEFGGLNSKRHKPLDEYDSANSRSKTSNPPLQQTKDLPPKASNFSCDECDQSYTRKFSLIKHKKEKHNEVTANKSDATVVHRKEKAVIEQVPSSDGGEDESRMLESKKPVCAICNKTFKLESHLKLHTKKFHRQQTQVGSNEGGIFVAVTEDELSATKLEAQQAEAADPFLSDMREKLLQLDSFEPVDGYQEDLNYETVTVAESIGEQTDMFVAVDEALHNDFLIA